MSVYDIPALILGITVNSYWLCVLVMSIRVRRRAGGMSRVWVPAQRREQVMWAIWIPTLILWMHLPFRAAIEPAGAEWLSGVPVVAAANPLLHSVRWAAAVVAVIALGLSIVCWRHMGASWRMGVDSDSSRLIEDGPFAWVRHPIYSLGSLIMVCSVIILPAPAMLAVATIHISLLNLKARNEEQFLRKKFGGTYESYCRRIGRFIPRLRIGHSIGNHDSRDAAMQGRSQSRSDGRSDTTQEMNFFQRVMLMWEAVHSYNAAHAVRIDGPADGGKLRNAIEQICRERGIGDVLVDQANRVLVWSAPTEVEVQTADRRTPLAGFLAKGLNASFSNGQSSPFRWTTLEELEGDGHYVILVYRHVIADGRSIERFLGEVMHRYVATGDCEGGESERPHRRARIARPTASGGRVRGFLRSARLTQRIKKGFCFPEVETVDNSVHVVIRSAEHGLTTGLDTACRQRGIGVTDLFLAALASAIVETPAYSSLGDNAPGFGLGTVVRDRSTRSENGVRKLGVGLHNLVVMINRPESGFDKVLDDIAAQTSWYKMHPRAVETVSTIRIRWAKHVWPLLGIRNERASYRKNFPICAGVSPVRVDPERFGPAAAAINRYVRAVPTGPTTPVVIAPTLFGDRLELSLTAMSACLTPTESTALLEGMLLKLSTFASKCARG